MISTPAQPTLLVLVTGTDRPGLSAALFAAVREAVGAGDVVGGGGLGTEGAEVLDVEQVVVRGHITLAVLLGGLSPEASDRVEAALTARAVDLDLHLTLSRGTGDQAARPLERAVVTVLGAPLLATHLATVTGLFSTLGANADRVRRMSRRPVTTVEYQVSGVSPAVLRSRLAAAAASEGFDVSVSPAGLARHGRRLVVMDVDSTLIQDEVIELLAHHAGREAEVAAVTERAMRGELDFTASLHERVATLAGLPETVIDEVRAAVRLTPGARTLVRTLKRLGFTVAVVSGGFIEVVAPLAAELGIDHAHANRLEVVDGRLTGRVLGDVVDRAEKARALRRFAEAEGLPLSRTVAIGDGANDLDMLAVAGLGVAFNAKPTVREQADTALNVPYLDAVLFLLGVTREEIEDADGATP